MMDTSQRQHDIVVFGATGFTGKLIVQEIIESDFKGSFAVAGRDQRKLEALAAELQPETKPRIVVADVFKPETLRAMAKAGKLLINAVGPFRYWGEPVLKACVESGTHYLDISAEREFIERSELEYGVQARGTGALAASAAGFDSAAADMGVLYTLSLFKPPARCTLVETFLTIGTGPRGFVVRYPTWVSAIESLGSTSELVELRKKVVAIKGEVDLKVPGPKPKRQLGAAYDDRVGAWTLPYMGADASVVRRTMQALMADGQPAANYSICFTLPSSFYKNLFLVFGGAVQWLARRPWSQRLLLAAPRLFSFGIVTRDGVPSEEQMKDAVFLMTNIGHGYSTGSPSTPDEEPDMDIITRVSGPGYAATSIFVVQAAITLLEERSKIAAPGGVFTLGTLLRNTSYVGRLRSRGIKFEQVASAKVY